MRVNTPTDTHETLAYPDIDITTGGRTQPILTTTRSLLKIPPLDLEQRIEKRRKLVFDLHLKPLIINNYAARARGDLPDEWFWADTLAVKWGYFVNE